MTRLTDQHVTDAIVSELREQGDAIATVAVFGNSFEPWLKFQLACGVARRLDLAPWSFTAQRGEVGVEYRYKKLANADEPAREKRIDLWVGLDPTVYVELKVVHCRANQSKQLRGWLADFLALRSVLEGEPDVAGFASVVLGVRFDDASWDAALASVDTAGGHLESYGCVRSEESTLHVASLTSSARS